MTLRDQWSAILAKKLPDAQIVGELGDDAGFLIVMNAEPSSDTLAAVEAALQAVGANGWHWSVADGHQIKVRAYRAKPARVAGALLWLSMCVLIAIFAKSHYDIHFAA